MKTEGSPSDRCRWKLNLLRPLYQRGLAADEIRQMFKFIDWMMELPDKLAIEFNHELEKIEMENMMPYVTSIERMALKRGTAAELCIQLEQLRDQMRKRDQ